MSYGICVSFNFPGDFFDSVTHIRYENRDLEICSGGVNRTHRVHCAISTEFDYKDAFKSISRFINELSWNLKLKIEDIMCVYGNGRQGCFAKNHLPRNQKYFIHDFVQTIFAPEQHLALGFYREGYSSNSPFYKFLSYYKIIEMPFRRVNEKDQWIKEATLKLVESMSSVQRLNNNGVRDITGWLSNKGRNALAHAFFYGRNTIDINNIEQWQDIVWANEIIKEIAEITIYEKLCVPRRK